MSDGFSRLSKPCPVAIGHRVRVTGIQPNDPDPMPVGSEGTVVGGNGEQIWVRWDNGRSLILLTDDPYEVLPERECRKCGALITPVEDYEPGHLLSGSPWQDERGGTECEAIGDHQPEDDE